MGKSEDKASKAAEDHEEEDPSANWDSPPPYELHSTGGVLASSAAVNANGTIDVEFQSFEPEALDQLLPPLPSSTKDHGASGVDQKRVPATVPSLNIVIQVVGSRGDVQPFIALGNTLQRQGHRVRLATHDNFADFVRSSSIEFFPIGGDPEDLMAYMVKNPGLIPSMESLRGGDIGRKRTMMHDMLRGCWASCVEPDPITSEPFVADAIIANPPSFAHVHCAEALGVPLHIMFTMPWSATRAFPHPLANVQSKNMDPRTSNYLSYGVVDLMTWQGLGDVINAWRVKCLGLEPLAAAVGPDIVSIMKVPQTYCWSPALVAKPFDWADNIDVCGFFLRDEPSFNPPQDLVDFLQAGPEPVYIGFGSIVLEDPANVTNMIKEASRRLGVRVIVSRGWSKLGGSEPSSDTIFYLGDCPHEWLFKRVAAVMHHGGAGTTACGLINGRPTSIVPFFGDQPFWGTVVASNGAGPAPVPYKKLTADTLTEAVQFCLQPAARAAAQKIAEQMRLENGVQTAVTSFHRHLPWDTLTCHVLPQYVARWRYVKTSKKNQTLSILLSDEALRVLVESRKVKMSDVEPIRTADYATENIRWDPITAGASSVMGTVTDFTTALGGTFIDPFKNVKRVRADGTRGSAVGVAALTGVGKGVGGMAGAVVKGAMVDMPLALAEGLRQAPKLLGDDVRDHGPVKDWKSGGTVAMKNFGYGFYDGMVGFVKKPMDGAKEGGAGGLLKGVGQGTMGLIAKPGSAMFGLLAYPAQGAYKSAQAAMYQTAKKDIEKGRVSLLESMSSQGQDGDSRRVVQDFASLTSK